MVVHRRLPGRPISSLQTQRSLLIPVCVSIALLTCGCGDEPAVQHPTAELSTSLTDVTGSMDSSAAATANNDSSVRRTGATPDESGGQESSSGAVAELEGPQPAVNDEDDQKTSPSSLTDVKTTATGVKDSSETDDQEATTKVSEGTKLPADLLAGSQVTPLNPQKTVLLDLPGKRVLLRARVCLTQGLLEMLLCPAQTKEHESILSTESQAFTVHTGLLALGCKEGQAAKYDSETEAYTPPSGQVVDIFLHWVDTKGKLRREPAQHWVRHSRQRYYEAKFETLPADLTLEKDGNLRYDEMNQVIFWYGPMSDRQRDECLTMSSDPKFQDAIRQFHRDSRERPMTADWVFVGSGFYQDGDSARQYLAEGGYMICVANFAMAMIDVATPSDSNGTESLAYEAATERIPPRGSEVLIELVPRPLKEPAGAGEKKAIEPAGDDADGSGPKKTDEP